MIIFLFLMENKEEKSSFLEESFLLANISMDIVFQLLFFTLNNIEVNLNKSELGLRLYTTAETLSTTKQVDLVGKKEFAGVSLNPKDETSIVYIVSLTIPNANEI